MKKILLLVALFWVSSTNAQKKFSEGTISFFIETFVSGNKLPDDATAVQLTKGGHFRNDIIGSMGNSVTIFDAREGKGAMISEFGSQRILIPLNRENWEDKNARFKGISFFTTDETKSLLGFDCIKAIAKLQDSTLMEVFYAKEISPENPNVETMFGALPGIVLQYTYTKGITRVSYTATSLDFDPVPIQKFDIPNTGYRIMTYEESKKGRKN